MTESWKTVWRKGIAPQLSTKGLQALAKALTEDAPTLLQGATTSPPPLQACTDWPVEAACLIGYCGWQGDGLQTVSEVEEFFGKVCFAADLALDEPAAVRWCLNYFDETPREQMRREFIPEVAAVLKEREGSS